MHDILKLLIPLLSLSIPLVAIIGHQIVRPLAGALGKLAAQQDRLADPRQAEAEMAELQARMERMERVLARVVDEQKFQRALMEGAPRAEMGSLSLSGGRDAVPLA